MKIERKYCVLSLEYTLRCMAGNVVFWALMVLLCAGPVTAIELMLPQIYDEDIDVRGWLVSEKLDGVRGYWDGAQLLSKNGKIFHPPAEFIENFPDFPLEGELWGGRQTFEKTISIVKQQRPHKGWLSLQFAVFDVPEKGAVFTKRLAKAKQWFTKHPSAFSFIIEQKPVQGRDELQERLQTIEKLGGEGLIVRRPDALYRAGRSSEILKVKNYRDTEAVVVDYLPGKGRNKGKMGSLLVQLPNGFQFRIGSGFTDAQREEPPPIGATITFKYYGLYASGIPKFPSFLRVRQEM